MTIPRFSLATLGHHTFCIKYLCSISTAFFLAYYGLHFVAVCGLCLSVTSSLSFGYNDSLRNILLIDFILNKKLHFYTKFGVIFHQSKPDLKFWSFMKIDRYFQVFPPAFRELPPPSLELFDLDEQFSSEKVRIAQITNKCESNVSYSVELFFFICNEVML